MAKKREKKREFDLLARPESETRPSLFGNFMSMGTRFLAMFSAPDNGGGGAGYDDNDFHVNPKIGQGCCGLATTKQCKYTGDKSNYVCPDGYSKTFWVCTESGGTQFGCGECSETARQPPTPSCFVGPWECSIWWNP